MKGTGYFFFFGCCIDYLRTLATASVHLVVCDSPYENTDLPFDKQPVDWAAFWAEIRRVLAPNGVVICFAAESFTLDLIASNRPWYRYRRVWVKSRGSRFLDKENRPLCMHEDIVLFMPAYMASTYNPQKTARTGPKKTVNRKAGNIAHYGAHREAASYDDDGTRYPTTVMYYPSVGTTAHHHNPTAKPLGLVEELVLTYSNPGDTVLEPFGGDVPAGVACLKNNRQYHGCEKDFDQHEWSAARLQAAAVQPQLIFS